MNTHILLFFIFLSRCDIFLNMLGVKYNLKNFSRNKERNIKMNCEKCKNKTATVFYADDTGGRHSLCESCAAILGHLGRYSPSSAERNDPCDSYTPDCRLFSLSPAATAFPIYASSDDDGKTRCQYCSSSLEAVISSGELGCPECYSAFSKILFPMSLDCENAAGARMPQSRRANIDRIHMLAQMKKKLREAVDSENYELAATLRDEIRRLDGEKKGR